MGEAQPGRVRVARARGVTGDRDLVVGDPAFARVLDQDLRRPPRRGRRVPRGHGDGGDPELSRVDRLADEVEVARGVVRYPRIGHPPEALRPALTRAPRHVGQLCPARGAVRGHPRRKAAGASIRPAVLLRRAGDLGWVGRVDRYLRLDLGVVVGGIEVRRRAKGTGGQRGRPRYLDVGTQAVWICGCGPPDGHGQCEPGGHQARDLPGSTGPPLPGMKRQTLKRTTRPKVSRIRSRKRGGPPAAAPPEAARRARPPTR
jgi:hypothetical protein